MIIRFLLDVNTVKEGHYIMLTKRRLELLDKNTKEIKVSNKIVKISI